MENELELNQSDAQTEVSSEPQSESSSQSAEQKPADTNNQDSTTPFHEHPRFKELVEQKNSALAAQKQYEQRIAQMETQLKSFSDGQLSKKQEDALISRLKGIDPEFGERIEKFNSALPSIEALQNKIQAMEKQQFQEKAVSQVTSLHNEYKVSKEMQEFYNAQLILAEQNGKIKGLDDIASNYKQIHETFSKLLDSVKRTERESYAKAKKEDVKAPTSQPKGKPALPTKEHKFSKDKEAARAEVVSRYLKMSAQENDI